MKITRKNLKRLIETYLVEGILTNDEKAAIRDQVRMELSRSFWSENVAKTREEYSQLEAQFEKMVNDEANKRIVSAAAAKPDGEYDEMKVKIEDKPKWSDQDWNDAFNQQQEIVPYQDGSLSTRTPSTDSNLPPIDVTPEEGEDVYTGPLTQKGISRRDFIKGAGMGLAVAGQIGGMSGLFDQDFDFASFEDWLLDHGYEFEEYEVITVSKDNPNFWDDFEGNGEEWFYTWVNVALWLSYHMPELGILTPDDMAEKGLKIICAEAGDLYNQLSDDFVPDASQPGTQMTKHGRPYFGDDRITGTVPGDAEVLGNFRSYNKQADGSIVVGVDFEIGKIHGRRAIRFMDDEAIDYIVFLE